MPVTELEGVILGVVESRGTCSAYAVRKRFEASPTWGWSASKGAIYPAVRRLLSRGYLQSGTERQGRQEVELLSITAAGLEQLSTWLLNVSTQMGAAPVDPFRTRVNYLGALRLDERREFLDQAERVTRKALEIARKAAADPAAKHSWALEASLIGVRMQVETKIRWLRRVRKIALRPES